MSKLKSENSFLVKGDDGRGEFGKFDSSGWPKTRPVAAAATTVPVPTSYRADLVVSNCFTRGGAQTIHICQAGTRGAITILPQA